MKKILLTITVIILGLFSLMPLLSSPEVVADFPDATTYRVPVQINYSNNVDSTDYQISITLNTATLVSNSKMRSDCGDLRVRDSDDLTTLSYWIESGCNSASTKIWVKIPQLYASTNKTIYLYYGNPAATSQSNGGNTFAFFDDFNSFNDSVWTSSAGSGVGYSINASTLTLTQGAIYTDAIVTAQPGYINETQLRWTENAAQSGLNIASRTDTQSGNSNSARLAYLLKGAGLNELFLLAATGSAASYDISTASEKVADLTLSTTYIIGTGIDASETRAYLNRSEITGSTAPYEAWSGNYYLWLGYFSGSNASTTAISDTEYDWVLTRKYLETEPSVSVGSEQSTQQYSIRFYGNGVNAVDQDRIKISLNNPAKPIDVANDFTIEFWMRAQASDNTSSSCTSGAAVTWINGNIIVDRDIYGDGDNGDYGIALYGGKIAYGTSVGTSNRTMCSVASVDDDTWHHVAVTRNSTTGQMRIFIDGNLDSTDTGPTGDISYRNNRTTSYPNSDPFLVLGAEKHDAGAEYPSYNGYLDEFRVSDTIRYTGNFSVPGTEFQTDANTVALLHFNEGSGTLANDVSAASGGPSHGILSVGGSPSGPAWSTEVPSLNTLTSATPTPTATPSPSPSPSATPTPTPQAPTNLILVGGDARIYARWTAPAAGEAPTDYVIEYRIGSDSYSVFNDGTSTTTSTTITGLTNGETYEIRVAGSNAGGTGAYSATATATTTSNTLDGVLLTGQSFAMGYDGTAALSTTQPYENLKIKALQSNFATLIEDVDPNNDNTTGNVETPASALANLITNLATGSPQIVLFNNAVPGADYNSLKKGTTPYNNGLTDITTADGLTTNLSRSLRIIATANLHGPADRANAAAYPSYLDEWQADYQSDIQAITSQAQTIPMFIDQSSNFTGYNESTSELVIAQLSAAQNNNQIYMVGPKYQFAYAGDNVHLTNQGYRWLGEYYGKAIKRVVYDSQSITALAPAEVVRNRDIISLRLDVPAPPIAIDTTNVLSQTNYGFEYTDSGSPPSITNVQLDGQDTVRITLSATPTGASQKLRYAYTGTSGAAPGAQSSGSARGNIRDSDATSSLYGNNLYNWLVHFDNAITVDESPATISSFSITPTSSSASISWNTNENSSSQVQYGTTSSLGTSTVESNLYPRVTSHSINLSNLAACTQFYVRAVSEDLAQNSAQNSIQSFHTSGCLGDAAVSSSTASQISNATGGNLTYSASGREVLLNIPSSFGSGDATFQVLQLNRNAVLNTTSSPSNYVAAGENIFEINALQDNQTKITSFNSPVTIRKTYLDNDISGLNEESLVIYRWNGSAWSALNSCNLNTSSNYIECQTSQFSVFGLFGLNQTPTPTPTASPTSDTSSNSSPALNQGPASCPASAPSAGVEIFQTSSTSESITLFLNQAGEPYNKIAISYGYSSAANTFSFIFQRSTNSGVLSYTLNHLSPSTNYYIRAVPINDCHWYPRWSGTVTTTTSPDYSIFTPRSPNPIIPDRVGESETNPKLASTDPSPSLQIPTASVSPSMTPEPSTSEQIVSRPWWQRLINFLWQIFFGWWIK